MSNKKLTKTKRREKEMSAARMMFWTLAKIFALTLVVVVVPAFREYIDLFFVIIFGATFSFLGAGLIFLTKKEKVKRGLRKFLILTGASAVGFVAGSILHNLFYGLGEIAGDIIALNFLAQVFHVIFFIIAVLICPFVFLVGAAGSMTLLAREKKGKSAKKK